ncbi:MAG: LapA family protein [bacterium]
MWVVRGILFLVLLFVLVFFFHENSNTTVDIKLFGRSFLDISLFWVFVLSFLLGFTGCFVWASVRWISLHNQLRRLRGEIKAHEQEIVDLRTLPLADMTDEPEAEEETGD